MTLSMKRTLAYLGLALAFALGAFASPAAAKQTIIDYSVGSSQTQAGAHPNLRASFSLEKAGNPETAKDISANLPAGIFGNPGAINKCPASDFVLNECAPDTQAGLITLYANYEGEQNHLLGTAPLFNMVRISEDEAARFAFVAPQANVPVSVPVTVRSASDYGLNIKVSGIPQSIPVSHVDLEVWGIPALGIHNGERFPKGSPGLPPGCPEKEDAKCAGNNKVGLLPKPFTHNPSVCTSEPLPVTLEVVTYQDPNDVSKFTDSFKPTTGCEKQTFKPFFNGGLTTVESDSPAGIDIQLKADQFIGTAPSPSELRHASLTLPVGVSINPDAADGQTSCTDAEAGFGTDAQGQCPDNAKIGTVEVITPALDAPLEGSIYIGAPQPGNQYRLFMLFDGFGVHAKLNADVHPDPVTGQLTISMTDLPQVPFETFNLHLFASDRGLMATPTRCTIYRAAAHLVPWNDLLSSQDSEPSFGITSGPAGSPCPGQIRPFEPRLAAGTSNSKAGDFSSFILRLDRDDGDQFLGDLNFRLPPGFTGDLSGISYCPDSSIAAAAQNLGLSEKAAPSCPASSAVGTSNVAAGPGGHPFHAVGTMYLAGPFKGAPLSVVAVTPALAGPYDYGVVVVRVALHINPLTAQVFAASDTVPSVIGGIPIRMRTIQVNIDRPNFTINPTNCEPSTVDSQGIGDEGTVTDFSSYFQAVNCAALAFKPKMKVRTVGKKNNRSQNPTMKFDLTTRPGDANIRSLSVMLPKAFEIDQRHLGNICAEKELTAKECAGRTAIGKATTTTPLLDQPLSGPVYAVSGSGGLPRLAFILNGQVDLLPRADTKAVNGKLKTTVPVVPDAPIGHFSLTVFGGKNGYLANTRSICARTPLVKVSFAGQNGKQLDQNVKVKTNCGRKAK